MDLQLPPLGPIHPDSPFFTTSQKRASSTPHKLAEWIEEHGHHAMVSKGKLYVHEDTPSVSDWECIEATVEAVRLWLGY